MTTANRARRTTRRQRQRAKRSVTQRPKRSVATQRPAEGTAHKAAARPPYALVAGEQPDLVLQGLLAFQDFSRVAEDGPDGKPRLRFELTVSPDDLSMGPFFRALMRVEAELILRDAEELSSVALMRSDDERRGDAFFLLARRVCEEIRRCSGTGAAA